MMHMICELVVSYHGSKCRLCDDDACVCDTELILSVLLLFIVLIKKNYGTCRKESRERGRYGEV